MPVYQFQHIPAGGHDSTAFLYENTRLTRPENGSPRVRATIARFIDHRADVAEWADARDLKSRAFGHVGSSPTVGTRLQPARTRQLWSLDGFASDNPPRILGGRLMEPDNQIWACISCEHKWR